MQLCVQSEGKIKHVALVCDIRGRGFDHLIEVLEDLEETGFSYEILFLEASDEALVRRYKESRRRHPLVPEGTILEGIRQERQRLQELRGRAHRLVDTSSLSPRSFEMRSDNGLPIIGSNHPWPYQLSPLGTNTVFRWMPIWP